MSPTEVRMLWLYAGELWGATFDVPLDSDLQAVKQHVWLDILGDLSADDVRRTMVELADRHFAPTPGELRTVTLRRLAAARKGLDEAMAEMWRLVSHFGWPSEAEALAAADEFDPALGGALRALGWLTICTSENPDVLRGQFRVVYEAASSRIQREHEKPAPALAAAMSKALKRAED